MEVIDQKIQAIAQKNWQSSTIENASHQSKYASHRSKNFLIIGKSCKSLIKKMQVIYERKCKSSLKKNASHCPKKLKQLTKSASYRPKKCKSLPTAITAIHKKCKLSPKKMQVIAHRN